MNNVPNMFRVHFTVEILGTMPVKTEDRYMDIFKLGDVRKFTNATSVIPIFLEVAETPLTESEIDTAIQLQQDTEQHNNLVNNVSRLKDELAQAELDLSKANNTPG